MDPITLSEDFRIPGTDFIAEKGDRLICRRLPDSAQWERSIQHVILMKPKHIWCASTNRSYPIDDIHIGELPPHVHASSSNLGLYVTAGSETWLLNPYYWTSYDPKARTMSFADEIYKFT